MSKPILEKLQDRITLAVKIKDVKKLTYLAKLKNSIETLDKNPTEENIIEYLKRTRIVLENTQGILIETCDSSFQEANPEYMRLENELGDIVSLIVPDSDTSI
jgi:hypothetical protein